jgi:hypothetical protein
MRDDSHIEIGYTSREGGIFIQWADNFEEFANKGLELGYAAGGR